MTALDFPSSPSNGDIYENYVYDSTVGAWKRIASGIELGGISDVTITSPTDGQALVYDSATSTWVNGEGSTVPVIISETAPVSPEVGELWLNSTEAKMYVYYDDGTSAQWVAAVGGTVPQQGKIIAVKSAIFTGTQSASVTAGSNVAVTDLSITHEVADASNKLIISVFLGVAASSEGFGNVGLAVHDGTSLIAVGDAVGTKTSLTAGGFVSDLNANYVVTMPSVTFVHTPGAGSKTYTVRAINISTATRTLFINRRETELDSAYDSRGVSSLVIQEVSV